MAKRRPRSLKLNELGEFGGKLSVEAGEADYGGHLGQVRNFSFLTRTVRSHQAV